MQKLVDRGFRVIRFDNRDVGLSTKIDAPRPDPPPGDGRGGVAAHRQGAYLLGDMADDTAGLLDALGIDRAHVVGMSMGGMISQTLAFRHPDRVASLTSVMSNTGDRRHGRVRPSLLRRLPGLISRDPAEAIENGLEDLRADLRTALRSGGGQGAAARGARAQ